MMASMIGDQSKDVEWVALLPEADAVRWVVVNNRNPKHTIFTNLFIIILFMELWMAESAIRDTSPINTTVERVGLLFLLQLWLSHHETLGAICCLSAAKVRRIIGLAKDYVKNVIDAHHYIILIINALTFQSVKYSVSGGPCGTLRTAATEGPNWRPTGAFGNFDEIATDGREAIRKLSRT